VHSGPDKRPDLDTIAVYDYVDGKLVASERQAIQDGVKNMRKLLNEGYNIVYPKKDSDD
jgi:hypothetical protein